MPLPLIWAVGAMAVGAAKKSYDGGRDILEAKATQELASARVKAAETKLNLRLEAVKQQSQELIDQKVAVMGGTMASFVRLWERQKQRANVTDKDFAVHLNISQEKLEDFRGFALESLDIANGLFKAGKVGMTTGLGVIGAVTQFGAASTGAAISGLSGAAANSALLAWLGGGTLASGGGGVALGTIVAGGLFAAPAALVGSLVMAKKGVEAKTAAAAYAAKVDVFCEDVKLRCVDLDAIERRLDEMSYVIAEVTKRLRKAIAQCEADEAANSGNVQVEHFYMAATLAKTLSSLLTIPVIDEEVKPSKSSEQTIKMVSSEVPGLSVENASHFQHQASITGEEKVNARRSRVALKESDTTEISHGVVMGLHQSYLVVADGDAVQLTLLKSPGFAQVFKGHNDTIYDIAVSRDGKYIASASRDRTARVWEIESRKSVNIFSSNNKYAMAIAVSPNNDWVAVGYGGGQIKVYDLLTGDVIASGAGEDSVITTLEFSPDGQKLAAGFEDGHFIVIEVPSGTKLCNKQIGSPVRKLAFSPDGTLLAIASDNRKAELRRVDNWATEREFDWNRRYVYGLAFHPTLPIVATAFADGVVKLWHYPSGEELLEVGQPGNDVAGVYFSDAGDHFVVPRGNKVERFFIA